MISKQDMFILGLLLMSLEIKAESSGPITLPDGRNIPDPSSYRYLDQHSEPTVLREFVLVETNPTTAIMCPKGYSIGEISQVLLLNSNINDGAGKIPFQTDPQRASLGQLRIPDAACPRLFKCLAYQACLFKFGNEFCGRDAAPLIRKLLQVNVTCARDDLVPKREDRRSDLVLHMTYKSTLEEGVRDYSGTVVRHTEIGEEEVFGSHCPSLDAALKEGYAGSCIQVPSSSAVVKEQFWSVLGRTSSKMCREELRQVFCAFIYSNQGLCVPPIFHEKKSEVTYNFRSLPKVGNRPTDVSYEQLCQQNCAYDILVRLKDFLLQVVLNAHPSSLVPARLAFLLLLHKDISAAVDLLELIYRPYNWYVIHVDSRAHAVRQELYHTLKQVFRGARNIIVLPEERSFATSWASYDIVRAELEGFEELLRAGVWDFAINLSGADYPLRDVDDLAASLAPYRGMNFLPFVQWRKLNDSTDDSSLLKKAFYACDGYVYDIKVTPVLPNADDLKIYNSPQWGVFSRGFISYLVNATARSEGVNRFQFYLQTHVVPDESYIPTLLMNSRFKSTVRTANVHTSKEFASENINNLCRHSNDADFCGRGPAVYNPSDVPDLLSASHRSFFARKFRTDLSDKTRSLVRDLSQNGYYKFFEQHLPDEILKTLAESAMSVVTGETSLSKLKFNRILRLRALPSLLPHDPCCQSPFLSRIRKIIDYVYWLDFSLVDTENGEVKDARVVLEPSLSGRVCYPDGHLKMAFITPWVRDVLRDDPKNGTYSAKVGLDETLPLPFGPAHISDVSVVLFFSRSVEDATNCSSEGNFGMPIVFPDSGTQLVKSVEVLWQLVAPDQRIQCVGTETIMWNFKDEEEQQSSDLIHPIMINCGVLQPGPWQIRMLQVNISNGRVYNFPFYLLDYSNKESLSHQLVDVIHLWKVKEASLLFNGMPSVVTTSAKTARTRKVWLREKSYKLNPHKGRLSKLVRLTTRKLISKFVDLKNVSARDPPTLFCMMLWSGGTAITFVSFILIQLWVCHNRVVLVLHHRLLFSILLFGTATLVQIMLSLSFC